MKLGNKTLILTLLTVLLIAPILTISQVSATDPLPPNWDVTGDWIIRVYALSVNKGLPGNLYPVPAFITVHGIKTTGD